MLANPGPSPDVGAAQDRARAGAWPAGAIVRDLLMAALIGTVGWSATEFQGMRVALVEVKTTMRNYDSMAAKVEAHERDIAVLRSRMDAYHGSAR